MDKSTNPATDNTRAIQRAINVHISLWKWALGMGLYFPISQLLSVIGSQNPEFPSDVWIIFSMQAFAGALFGALLAMGARGVVKAIRCSVEES